MNEFLKIIYHTFLKKTEETINTHIPEKWNIRDFSNTKQVTVIQPFMFTSWCNFQ